MTKEFQSAKLKQRSLSSFGILSSFVIRNSSLGDGYSSVGSSGLNFPSLVLINTSVPLVMTFPSRMRPLLSLTKSGWLFNHGLSLGFHEEGTVFCPLQMRQVALASPWHTGQFTRVVPPQTLHLPILTALPC